MITLTPAALIARGACSLRNRTRNCFPEDDIPGCHVFAETRSEINKTISCQGLLIGYIEEPGRDDDIRIDVIPNFKPYPEVSFFISPPDFLSFRTLPMLLRQPGSTDRLRSLDAPCGPENSYCLWRWPFHPLPGFPCARQDKAAARRADYGSSLHQGLDEAFLDCLPVNERRAWYYDKPDAFRCGTALQDG